MVTVFPLFVTMVTVFPYGGKVTDRKEIGGGKLIIPTKFLGWKKKASTKSPYKLRSILSVHSTSEYFVTPALGVLRDFCFESRTGQ